MNTKNSTSHTTLRDVTFLRVFVLFIEDIMATRGISNYRIIKEANITSSMVSNCKRLIVGKSSFTPNLSLNLIIYLSKFYSVNFDLSKYLAVIAEQDRLKLLSEVPSDGLPT